VEFNCSQSVIENAKNIADDCTGCKLCMKQCVMLNNYCSSPKELFQEISSSEKVNSSIPYSCSMCNKCTMVCPKDLKLGEAFMGMRDDIVSKNKGKSPMKGHAAIENHQMFSFSKLFKTSVPDTKAGYTNRAFIPGCSLSSYNPDLVGKTIDFLQERLPGTGAVLMCCGKPTRDLGQVEKFKERYALLQKELDDLGVEEVITACQNCYMTISENSPMLKVKSLWEVIPEIGLSEEHVGKGKESDIEFSIHDACPTRYNTGIHDGVRWIVNELGYKMKESDHSREKTNCCGFGGMIVPANPELGKSIMKKSASALPSDYVITYCASCREAMAMGGKRSVHILNLLFNRGWSSNSEFPGIPKGTIDNWLNRYKSKAVIHRRSK
jgi:Fe-S oxidoreductase